MGDSDIHPQISDGRLGIRANVPASTQAQNLNSVADRLCDGEVFINQPGRPADLFEKQGVISGKAIGAIAFVRQSPFGSPHNRQSRTD